jgi:hypothetical protein
MIDKAILQKPIGELTTDEIIGVLKSRSSSCKKDQSLLTNIERDNSINLRQNSEAIWAGFDEVLKINGVNLHMRKFVLSPDLNRRGDGLRGYECTCSNGWAIDDCDDCWWVGILY